jgi:hypothetical protein
MPLIPKDLTPEQRHAILAECYREIYHGGGDDNFTMEDTRSNPDTMAKICVDVYCEEHTPVQLGKLVEKPEIKKKWSKIKAAETLEENLQALSERKGVPTHKLRSLIVRKDTGLSQISKKVKLDPTALLLKLTDDDDEINTEEWLRQPELANVRKKFDAICHELNQVELDELVKKHGDWRAGPVTDSKNARRKAYGAYINELSTLSGIPSAELYALVERAILQRAEDKAHFAAEHMSTFPEANPPLAEFKDAITDGVVRAVAGTDNLKRIAPPPEVAEDLLRDVIPNVMKEVDRKREEGRGSKMP